MAEVVVLPAAAQAPQQHLFLLPSLPYNITLNITSILNTLLPSRFLTRSGLFTSIRRKWWQDVVDVGMPATGVASETTAAAAAAVGSEGMMVDIAAWPTESMLEAVVNEVSSVSGVSVGAGGVSGAGSTSAAAATAGPSLASQSMAYMGPWSFFASGYMLGLFLVAILLHRIQNIIIPSRVLTQRNLGRPTRAGRRNAGWVQRSYWMLGGIWDVFFPLDLSKTATRLALHLPSLYYLTKWLFVWLVLALQTSHLYPVDTGLVWVDYLGSWVEHKDMSEVCWKTFLAVCAGFTVEGFVKALDGVEAGFPIGSNMNPNTSPFNIVGYAFLLHLYASPFAHAFSTAKDLPSRPDKHAIITIAIPLLQLTMFHALSISRRLSTHRLLPTTLSSVLSLTHFHGALFSYFHNSDWSAFKSPLPSTAPPTRLLTTYPILNYIPNIFETILLLTILLTVLLNIVVQLIVRGRVDRVFSGLGIGPSSSFYAHQNQSDDETEQQQGFNTAVYQEQEYSATFFGQIRGYFQGLPYDEDFGVLLLRIGTASLEATGLRGWSNEVAPIPAPLVRDRQRHRRLGGRGSRGSAVAVGEGGRPEYGSVRVGRLGAGSVQPGYRVASSPQGGAGHVSTAGDSGPGTVRRRRMGERPATVAMRGLRNEVRMVDLGQSSSGSRDRGFWERGTEMLVYLEAAWAAFKGFVFLVKAWSVYLVKGRGRGKRMRGLRRGERQRRRVSEGDDVSEGEGWEEDNGERDREVYQRFLRGENITDDEGEDEEYREDDIGDQEEEEEEGQHDNGNEDDEREAFGLFTDILRNGTGGSRGEDENGGGGVGGEVVLAHLVDKSPMTRRRWRSLSSPGNYKPRQRTPGSWDGDDDDDPFVVSSSESTTSKDIGREIAERSVCVICTSEARDVICWPCRCLAMCDGCREALAGRSAPAKHRCPCCRALIEGYSKIYVP